MLLIFILFLLFLTFSMKFVCVTQNGFSTLCFIAFGIRIKPLDIPILHAKQQRYVCCILGDKISRFIPIFTVLCLLLVNVFRALTNILAKHIHISTMSIN